MRRLEAFLEWGGMKKDVVCLVLSGAALIGSMFRVSGLPFDLAWAAIILCGVPIILEAVVGLVTAFDIKADVLVSLALIASVLTGEEFAAGEVAFIMQLGGLLEELTVARARAGIEKLVHLTPTTARILTDGGQERIADAAEVQAGDRLRVLPGETVPVDGVILTGQTSVNQAVMTGESLPVEKGVGDEVSSGTVNQFGVFEMKALRVGEDSSIQRMIRLVQSADARKAKIVGIADRWATWIVVTALLAAALTWLATGEILRAVTILVVFCPCALVLATPTAIMAAIGNATKHGFLVREGDALERLSAVDTMMFDKTGTLTCGTPRVVSVQAVLPELGEESVFRFCAAAEQLSEHPLGKAVVACWQETQTEPAQPGEPQTSLPQAEQFSMIPGRGVACQAEGRQILAGNEAMLLEQGILCPEHTAAAAEGWRAQGSTVIYVALDGKLAGFLALSDTLREESAGMIGRLKNLGIRPVLLTGDQESAARSVAKAAGIQEIHAGCLPEEKLKQIGRRQKAGQIVCMIGDGVNDAPALKRADVGIAMGGVGSDIAVEAADIALVDDEVKQLPHLIALSRRMMTTIKVNMSFSMALNFLAIVLAMTGVLSPVAGALVHNAGSVLVIVHSAFLLSWKKTGN